MASYLIVCVLPLAEVAITLLQPVSNTAVRLYWNSTGVPRDTTIVIGYLVKFRSKLSVKRQTGGVQSQEFPSNATSGIISSLEPSYTYYEFSVQAIVNISGQSSVNPFVMFTSSSSLNVLTSG